MLKEVAAAQCGEFLVRQQGSSDSRVLIGANGCTWPRGLARCPSPGQRAGHVVGGPPLISHPGLPSLSDHLGNGTPGMVRCDGLAPSNVVDHLAQERQVDLGDASVTSLKVRF